MLTFNKTGLDDLLSVKEAGALSGYSSKHITQLCRENKVECRRIKEDWYIRRQSLLKYKDEMENKSSLSSQRRKKTRIASGFVTQVGSKLRAVGKKKKIIRLTRSPLVQEQFAGKKLVRLRSAIQEGSMHASKLLSSHVTNMPSKDFWHKALSALTAIILVFGSFYTYQSGFWEIGGGALSATAKSFEVASGVIVKFGVGDVPGKLTSLQENSKNIFTSALKQVESKTRLGALTVVFAKEEIKNDPFGFVLRGGYAWVNQVQGFYNEARKFSRTVMEGAQYSAMVGKAFR